jgi:hypothetical protein
MWKQIGHESKILGLASFVLVFLTLLVSLHAQP